MRDNGNAELLIEIHAARPILAAEFLDDGCVRFGVPMTVDFGTHSGFFAFTWIRDQQRKK